MEPSGPGRTTFREHSAFRQHSGQLSAKRDDRSRLSKPEALYPYNSCNCIAHLMYFIIVICLRTNATIRTPAALFKFYEPCVASEYISGFLLSRFDHRYRYCQAHGLELHALQLYLPLHTCIVLFVHLLCGGLGHLTIFVLAWGNTFVHSERIIWCRSLEQSNFVSGCFSSYCNSQVALRMV